MLYKVDNYAILDLIIFYEKRGGISLVFVYSFVLSMFSHGKRMT